VIGLGRYVLGKIWYRRENAAPSGYLAYSVGPELLAIGVQELKARSDEHAMKEAVPLFYEGLKRVEVWCGSRKVGDIPPNTNKISDGDPIRNSA
jgi:hypothetical protein